MKRSLLASATIVVGALYFGALEPADAALATLGPDNATEGLTYTLEMNATAGNKTASFALTITGENVSGTDTRGGRTAVEAFAFGDPAGDVSVASVSSPAGYTFVDGGLSNSGSPAGDCNGNGAFFCFHDQTVSTANLASGKLVFDFSATTATGDWSGFTGTAFKINWLGSQNNYSLVSEDIPVNTTCPDCVINPVIIETPEPASLALLGVGLLGIGATTIGRRR